MLGTAIKGNKITNFNHTNEQSVHTQINMFAYLLTVAEEIQGACTSICTHIWKALISKRKRIHCFTPNNRVYTTNQTIYTCGKRSSGFELGPPAGAAGCGACTGELSGGGFVACPLVGTRATGGISACSGIP